MTEENTKQHSNGVNTVNPNQQDHGKNETPDTTASRALTYSSDQSLNPDTFTETQNTEAGSFTEGSGHNSDPVTSTKDLDQNLQNPISTDLTNNSISTEPLKGSNTFVSKLKRHKKLVVTCGVVIVVTTLSTASMLIYTRDTGVIAAGTAIAGVNVSNLSPGEARDQVNRKIKSLLERPLRLRVGIETVELTLGNLGFSLGTKEVLAQAYRTGRQGNLFQKSASKLKAAVYGLSLTPSLKWDEEKLKATLQKALTPLNKNPTNAAFSFNADNTMIITPEKPGLAVDIAPVIAQIKQSDILNVNELTVSNKEIPPQVTAAQLEAQKITGLLATYTTKFDPSLIGRTENIRVAARTLNGKTIKPGEVFSFNDTVGPRTVEAGYKEAMIIENGTFAPGLGGGVCQVSSTLYNVLLLADLPIVERANHDLAIAYAPLGQDATVAYPTLDLKFKNDTNGYLLIRSKAEGDSLTFSLYGQVHPNREVIITNTVLSTFYGGEQRVIDSSLASGETRVRQGGQPGYVVSTIRTVKINGEITKKEDLGQSRYRATPRIVAAGP